MAKKRRKPSAWPSILSLASVMFMLGLLAISLVGFNGLSKHLMESSSIDVYFKDSITKTEVLQIEQQFHRENWVKQTKFVSAEEGSKEMSQIYDPEFMSYAENVALPLSIEIYPKAEFAQIQFIDNKAKNLKLLPQVDAVIFQRNWVESMTANVHKLQLISAGVTAILLIIAIVLIQSATRMGIFANRFLIKSMQLVGATPGFIIRPYVLNFLQYAAIAIPISSGSLAFLFYGIPSDAIRSFTTYISIQEFITICSTVSIFGVFLAMIGSWLSTQRYLNTKIENLY